MNKILFLLSGLFISLAAVAQINNGAFENWTTTNIDQPFEWYTSNTESMRNSGVLTATKESPGHSGNYAIKIETKIIGTDTNVGYFANTMDDPTKGEGGVPFTQQADSVVFWTKMNVQSPDTALLLVFFKKNGVIISTNVWKFNGINTSWERKAFALQIPLVIAPDTVIIGMACSNALDRNYGVNGSYMIVDDLAFIGGTVQPFIQGGFESWAVLSYEEPVGWSSGNIITALLGKSPSVTKTTDAYKGNYAAKIRTTEVSENYDFVNFILNGDYGDSIPSGGVPFSNIVDTLVGWYKYFPKTGDTAGVSLVFKNNGVVIQWSGLYLNAASSYTKFEYPFNLASTPDTVVIAIFSSNWPVQISDTGSVLYIDEVQFKSNPLNTGIEKYAEKEQFGVFPNPNNGKFELTYPTLGQNPVELHIYNLIGKQIKSAVITEKVTKINMENEPAGIYLLKLKNENTIMTRKIVVR